MSDAPARLYGLVAEYATAEALVHAAKQAHALGYVRLDAFSPYPIEELTEALELRRSRLPWLVFAGAFLGGVTGYLLQYVPFVIWYPMNVGGRPDHSWPSFIPVTFELTILGGALAAILSMFALNGLPMPYHPLFNVPRFSLATRDHFFLCIETADPLFDMEKTRRFLAASGASVVSDVPR